MPDRDLHGLLERFAIRDAGFAVLLGAARALCEAGGDAVRALARRQQ